MDLNLNNDWKLVLDGIINSCEFETLMHKVYDEYRRFNVCPSRDKIFAAFNLCPFDDVKVVILGQDPYFNPGQAVGVAFSVLHDCKKFPPTLANIIKEVRAEYGVCTVEDGDLLPWVRQGVLLLNTCLTVREGQPLSHNKIGWDCFINYVIKLLDTKDNIVFVFWGENAKKYMPFLTNKNNLVLVSSHPSPLSVDRGFRGCGHFKKINEFLVAHGKKQIVF